MSASSRNDIQNKKKEWVFLVFIRAIVVHKWFLSYLYGTKHSSYEAGYLKWLHISWYCCFSYSISLMIPLDRQCWSPCQRRVFCFVSQHKCSSLLLGPAETQPRLNKRNWHPCLRVTLDSWAFGKLALMKPLEAPSQTARCCCPTLGTVCACRPKKSSERFFWEIYCIY